jgi:hypothetical protein
MSPTTLISLLPERRSLVCVPPYAHPNTKILIIEMNVAAKKLMPVLSFVPGNAIPGAKSGPTIARPKTIMFNVFACVVPKTMNVSYCTGTDKIG